MDKADKNSLKKKGAKEFTREEKADIKQANTGKPSKGGFPGGKKK